MVALQTEWSGPDSLGKFSDVLRLRTGKSMVVRFVTMADAEGLQSYFRSLSGQSRYNRLMGAASELPPQELERALHIGEASRFAVVAEMKIDGRDIIVGEARYAFDADSRSAEFGLSIDDAWQGQGIGSALLANLECRSAALGAIRVFGETLRNNEPMIGLARKSGYSFAPTSTDWRQVRFEKSLPHAAEDIPCESWKRAAMTGALARAFAAAV